MRNISKLDRLKKILSLHYKAKYSEMNTDDVIEKLKKIKPFLQQEYAVMSLGLFGSFADGTHTNSSDVDLIVEFEHSIGSQFFKLEKYLEETLDRKIDLVTESALKKQIKPFILNQIRYI